MVPINHYWVTRNKSLAEKWVLFLKSYFVEGERCSDAVSRGLRELFTL